LLGQVLAEPMDAVFDVGARLGHWCERASGTRFERRRALGRIPPAQLLDPLSADPAAKHPAHSARGRGCGPTRTRDIRDRTLPDLDHLGRNILARCCQTLR
jgi:hypothetical protein